MNEAATESYWRGSGRGGYRDEFYMRYSVKCDRATSRRIEAAAKAAGLSASAFVQAHFATILDGPAPRAQAKPAAPPTTQMRADFLAAEALGITVTTYRLWRAMSELAGPDGLIQMSAKKLAETAGVAPASVPTFQARLSRIGLLEQVTPSAHRTAAVWRVLRPEGAP